MHRNYDVAFNSSACVFMIQTLKKYITGRVSSPAAIEKDVTEAYDLWAANYDNQPGNLMLDLDQALFLKMLQTLDIKGKNVADIGCGTGRHWAKILKQDPAGLTGFDVSAGMLKKLNEKFPEAKTHQITDDLFSTVESRSFDVIVSTLTVAHIENINAALLAWCRILKGNGDIILTDFHPDILASGGKRTFRHQNSSIAVKNFVHTTGLVQHILLSQGFRLLFHKELTINESVKHYYQQQNALPVYEKFKGFRVIYGMHFRRGNDPA